MAEVEVSAEEIDSVCQLEDRTARLRRFVIPMLLILCTSGWGFSIGLMVWRPASNRESGQTKQQRSSVNSAAPLPLTDSQSNINSDRKCESDRQPVTIRDLHLIDVMLEHGNVAHAMKAYSRLTLDRGTQLHDQLTYRLCVSKELSGQLEPAGQLYRQLVGQSENDAIRLAARLGQARIWIKEGRQDMARAVLARAGSDPVVIRSPEGTLAGEIAHLLAQSQTTKRRNLEEVALADDGVFTVLPRWSARDLLTLVDPHEEQKSESDDSTVPLEVTYRYGSHPDESRIRGASPSSALVVDIVQRLGDITETQFDWTDAARASVHGRSYEFVTNDVSLAIALDELLAVFDLYWKWDGDHVLILTPTDSPSDEAVEIRREMAGRLLRRAVAEYPDHALAKYSYLALGDLGFENGDFASSIAVYKQFEQQFPRTDDIVVAHFHSGKALLQLGEREAAIQRFFQVADGGHGHPLQSAANTFVGRLFLENGQVGEATRPLIRAVSTAIGTDRAVPAVTLASAYMMAGNSHAAVQILLEERRHILDSSVATQLRTVAEYITSYGAFLAAEGDVDVAQEGRRLVQSLSHLELDPRVGQHMLLLAGDGFEAVGLMSRMEESFAAALDQKLAPWIREQVGLRLVDSLLQSGRMTKARQLLEGSLLAEDQPLSVNATLQMARLYWMEDNSAEATQICRELLKHELNAEQKGQALRFLGQIYDSQADHYNAALCFAGMLPGEAESLPAALGQPTDDAKGANP